MDSIEIFQSSADEFRTRFQDTKVKLRKATEELTAFTKKNLHEEILQFSEAEEKLNAKFKEVANEAGFKEIQAKQRSAEKDFNALIFKIQEGFADYVYNVNQDMKLPEHQKMHLIKDAEVKMARLFLSGTLAS